MTRRAPGFVAAAFFDSAALLFIVVAIALAGSLAAYIFRDGLGMGLTILAAAALGTLALLAAVRGWRLLASRSPLLDKAGRLFGLFLLYALFVFAPSAAVVVLVFSLAFPEAPLWVLYSALGSIAAGIAWKVSTAAPPRP
ncbi:MAG: hypothetical protein A2X36_08095 [Elusimicrobia bacterium GWA2_69_24]|nr:MAG: hypothetical protein A2X36_08095 [Elusimicrobia bacterium GWA2_69_24]HBL18603.1 hypothetical protein [Elusimicrobiota bacterium]